MSEKFYPSVPLKSIFLDFTIISTSELKRKIEKRCIEENSIAIIEKHPFLGFIWHSLITGGEIFKKDISSQFEKKTKTNIYFIQAINGGLVKIGQADNPASRLKSHQCGSPVFLQIIKVIENVESSVERKLHKQFSKFRKHGEWFDPCVLTLEIKP